MVVVLVMRASPSLLLDGRDFEVLLDTLLRHDGRLEVFVLVTDREEWLAATEMKYLERTTHGCQHGPKTDQSFLIPVALAPIVYIRISISFVITNMVSL